MKAFLRVLALAATLAATAAFAQAGKKMELLWLGQSAFRITTPTGKVIVIDPFILKNPKTPAEWKDLAKLGHVDLILVSHAHFDHFADAPALAKMNHAPMWGPAGLQNSLWELKILSEEEAPRMGKGGTITPFGPDGVKITQTHADHSSKLIFKNAQGVDEVHVAGEPVGYIIELENGFRIYHTGDTALFGDMKLIGERYKPDLLLIPIGGHFVMNPVDAAYATSEFIKPKYAMPMHYGTTPQLKGTPEEYIKALGNAPVKVFVMKPGEKLEF